MNGSVKNIPMQKPIIPKQAIITATITKPNMIKNCLDTTVQLPLIASIALRFPKIIKGITRKVKIAMT